MRIYLFDFRFAVQTIVIIFIIFFLVGKPHRVVTISSVCVVEPFQEVHPTGICIMGTYRNSCPLFFWIFHFLENSRLNHIRICQPATFGWVIESSFDHYLFNISVFLKWIEFCSSALCTQGSDFIISQSRFDIIFISIRLCQHFTSSIIQFLTYHALSNRKLCQQLIFCFIFVR